MNILKICLRPDQTFFPTSNGSVEVCHKKNGIGYLELSIWVSLQRAKQVKADYIRKFVNIKKIQNLSGSNLSVQSPLNKNVFDTNKYYGNIKQRIFWNNPVLLGLFYFLPNILSRIVIFCVVTCKLIQKNRLRSWLYGNLQPRLNFQFGLPSWNFSSTKP